MESINMSLHVFEQHQVDRALDRTGQMILVVTAGVGVYDIDKSQKKAEFANSGYKIRGIVIKIIIYSVVTITPHKWVPIKPITPLFECAIDLYKL